MTTHDFDPIRHGAFPQADVAKAEVAEMEARDAFSIGSRGGCDAPMMRSVRFCCIRDI
jgi:hypothetical protein